MLVKSGSNVYIDFFLPDETDPWNGLSGVSPSLITVQYLRPGDSSFDTMISPAITETGIGWYRLQLTPTMTSGTGNLILRFTAAGAKPQQVMIQLVAFDPNDANSLGLARLDANVSSRAAPGSQMSLDSTTINQIASAVWSYVIEGTHTALKFMQWMGSVLFGKRTVSGTGRTYYAMDDTTVRVDGTVDSSGNRNITARN